MRQKRKGNSNRGFTLVEVLVAVVILAVVVVPLLNSFYTASRTNAKAKKLMDATTAAQNVFEELKAEKLDDFIHDHTATKTELLKGDGTAQLDEHGKKIYSYTLPDTSSPSNYTLTVDQRTFLARVTLDPVDYTTKESAAQKQSDYNTQLFAKLSKLSSASNAFYIEDATADLDNKAANNLATSVDPTEIENIKKSMSRTITVDIAYTESSKWCRVYVTVAYTDLLGGTYTPIDRQEIYNNNTALSNKLSNIFLCFLPMYSETGTKLVPKEKVIINNPTNYPVGIYMAKQTSRDDTANMVGKNNYGVELEVNEGNRVWDQAVTRVATNLRYEEGNTITSELTKVIYTGPTSIPSSMQKALDISDDLSRPEASVRIYKVKVEIFEKDDTAYANALTTMEGTKIE